jgi:hypothetical protein
MSETREQQRARIQAMLFEKSESDRKLDVLFAQTENPQTGTESKALSVIQKSLLEHALFLQAYSEISTREEDELEQEIGKFRTAYQTALDFLKHHQKTLLQWNEPDLSFDKKKAIINDIKTAMGDLASAKAEVKSLMLSRNEEHFSELSSRVKERQREISERQKQLKMKSDSSRFMSKFSFTIGGMMTLIAFAALGLTVVAGGAALSALSFGALPAAAAVASGVGFVLNARRAEQKSKALEKPDSVELSIRADPSISYQPGILRRLFRVGRKQNKVSPAVGGVSSERIVSAPLQQRNIPPDSPRAPREAWPDNGASAALSNRAHAAIRAARRVQVQPVPGESSTDPALSSTANSHRSLPLRNAPQGESSTDEPDSTPTSPEQSSTRTSPGKPGS